MIAVGERKETRLESDNYRRVIEARYGDKALEVENARADNNSKFIKFYSALAKRALGLDERKMSMMEAMFQRDPDA